VCVQLLGGGHRKVGIEKNKRNKKHIWGKQDMRKKKKTCKNKETDLFLLGRDVHPKNAIQGSRRKSGRGGHVDKILERINYQ